MSSERQIVIGGRYKYYVPPTEYIVNEVIMDATNEEATGKLPKTVIYTQVVAGIYPTGTRYSRQLEDFLSQIDRDGKVVNKFELVDNP